MSQNSTMTKREVRVEYILDWDIRKEVWRGLKRSTYVEGESDETYMMTSTDAVHAIDWASDRGEVTYTHVASARLARVLNSIRNIIKTVGD